MNYLHRLEHWGDTHHPRWLDFVRIALGAFLCYKGVEVALNMSSILPRMPIGKSHFGSVAFIFAAHFAAFAHILGGGLLILGLFTRFAALLQIPVLIGAVIFLSSNRDMLEPYSQIFISIFILLLLILFAVEGNGPLSFKIPEDKNHPSDQYPG
ncbi:DoxX family protein [soil metagenome]